MPSYKLTYSPYRDEEEQYRTAIKHTMKNMDTRYHLTLSFEYGMNERMSNELLNMLLKFINRSILKDRYNKAGQFIDGMAVREVTYAKENFHYHLLIADKYWMLPDTEKMEALIEKKIASVNKRYNSKNRISSFCLQEYYRDSLEDYLTKVFKKTSINLFDKMNSFQPLDHSGANFTLLRG
ncbi:hypothetical protein [Halomonas sp.]|uniref:hypothetical protein n=1 Tax=Halomonas sp. TaxID=1486246 RepID=UPI003850F3C4